MGTAIVNELKIEEIDAADVRTSFEADPEVTCTSTFEIAANGKEIIGFEVSKSAIDKAIRKAIKAVASVPVDNIELTLKSTSSKCVVEAKIGDHTVASRIKSNPVFRNILFVAFLLPVITGCPRSSLHALDFS